MKQQGGMLAAIVGAVRLIRPHRHRNPNASEA
jgi:hypothetical protein